MQDSIRRMENMLAKQKEENIHSRLLVQPKRRLDLSSEEESDDGRDDLQFQYDSKLRIDALKWKVFIVTSYLTD